MSERIKYCIPFVDNHINIHCAIHADNSGISVKYMLISLLIKQYALNDHSYISYKYTTLATRQGDVVVVRTALTAAMVVPSSMLKVYDPPNSETLISEFPSSKYI